MPFPLAHLTAGIEGHHADLAALLALAALVAIILAARCDLGAKAREVLAIECRRGQGASNDKAADKQSRRWAISFDCIPYTQSHRKRP